MKLSYQSKLMSGIILISIPTIQYGGYFLLGILSGRYPEMDLTGFQQAMFRAGHGHAGVLIILSLVCQLLADHAKLSKSMEWIARIGVPLAALLISGGFFGAAIGENITQPGRLIVILYTGIAVLAASVIILGIGLIRNKT